METYKKWLIFAILALAAYLVARFYQKRREIIAMKDAAAEIAPPTTAAPAEREGMTSLTVPQNLPLSNYFIKSSYNSCYNGGKLSTTQLEKVLRAGYRMIDLELGYISGEVKITANTEYSIASNVEGTTPILFSDALKSIATIGLTSSSVSAKNYNEPLFLHLRAKYNGDVSSDTEKTTVLNYYKAIVAALTENLGDYMYSRLDPRGNAINLSALTLSAISQSNRKCFIILDITNVNNTLYKSSKLSNYVHSTSGVNMGGINISFYDETRRAADDSVNVLNSSSTSTAIMSESTVKIESTGNTIDKKKLSIATFKSRATTDTLYLYDLVKFYGIQFMMVSHDKNDGNYKKYVALFASAGDTGFVLMSQVISGATKDIPVYDMRKDIVRGIYIGVFVCLFLFLMFYMYFFYRTNIGHL